MSTWSPEISFLFAIGVGLVMLVVGHVSGRRARRLAPALDVEVADIEEKARLCLEAALWWARCERELAERVAGVRIEHLHPILRGAELGHVIERVMRDRAIAHGVMPREWAAPPAPEEATATEASEVDEAPAASGEIEEAAPFELTPREASGVVETGPVCGWVDGKFGPRRRSLDS
jgi:hypothetical protein